MFMNQPTGQRVPCLSTVSGQSICMRGGAIRRNSTPVVRDVLPMKTRRAERTLPCKQKQQQQSGLPYAANYATQHATTFTTTSATMAINNRASLTIL